MLLMFFLDPEPWESPGTEPLVQGGIWKNMHVEFPGTKPLVQGEESGKTCMLCILKVVLG